jgi:hypothetical protein
LSPYHLFGVYNPGQRVLYPALFFFLTVLFPSYHNIFGKKLRRFIRIFLLGLVLIQILYLHLYVRTVSDELKENLTTIEDVLIKNDLQNDYLTLFAPDFTVSEIINPVYPYNYSFLEKFVPNIKSLSRLPYYLNIKYHTYTHIFPTGIIFDRYSLELPIPVSEAILLKKPEAIVAIFNSKEENRFIFGKIAANYLMLFENNYIALFVKRRKKLILNKEML